MSQTATMLRISDLRDPNDPQGRSYREVNASKTHKYPIGALVELNHGVRLWVVHHARDCDQTLLYCLSFNPNDTEIAREGFYNATWVKGIPVVNEPEGDKREHVAWCRYTYDASGGIRSIITCDSDAKGAFKVYR